MGPQPRHEGLAAERGADQVGVDHSSPLRFRKRAHHAGGADAGRVDEQVEVAPLMAEAVVECLPGAAVANVHRDALLATAGWMLNGPTGERVG
jgi:hypothetical protein